MYYNIFELNKKIPKINIYYIIIKQTRTIIKLNGILIDKSALIYIKELLAQTPHHIAWFLAQHINSILLTDMCYHMKKLMTYRVDYAAIRFTLTNGKNTPSFG